MIASIIALMVANAGVAQTTAGPCVAADALRAKGDSATAKARYLEIIRHERANCAVVAYEALIRTERRVRDLLATAELEAAHGRVMEAHGAYSAALAADPSSQEARSAFARFLGEPPSATLGEELRTAEQLLRLGRRDEALKIIEGVLKRDSNAAMSEELRSLTDPYAAARALRAVGDDTAAAEAVRASTASGLPIPPDLRDLNTDSEPRQWIMAKRWLVTIAEAAGVVALLALIAALMLTIWRRRQNLRLEISPFRPSETTVPTRSADSVSALLREALGRFRPNHSHFSIATVGDPIAPLGIPDAVFAAMSPTLTPIVRFLPDLVSNLGRGRVAVLDGQIHAPTTRGVGLTLTLTFADAARAHVTVWQRDFYPGSFRVPRPESSYGPADYYALVEPSAIWLLFQLQALEEPS